MNQYTLINNTAPEYDADGNMTTFGNGWVYTYNGENRITQATKGSTSVTMAYDYAGRRISKTVSVSGVVQNSYKYVYDGFKLIAVYNNNDLVMTVTWQPESLGMDVPVSMTYGGATYYYVTDGNKNVTALLDASGNRVAEYVYGPFGQTVSATGSMAQINPFRFSSEFHDDETGLVYYNYRYYSPELGRWTKRDPIEEDGGSNLYGFATNNAIIVVDHKGLEDEARLMYMYYMQNMGISEPGAAIYFPQERREKYMFPDNGLFHFDNAIKNNLKTLKKYKCTFIIAADNDDLIWGFIPGRFVPSQVVARVVKILENSFGNKCLNIIKLTPHSAVKLRETMETQKCICGIIYVGHANVNPPRIIFDNGIDSISTRDPIKNTRYLYSTLPTHNLLPGNTSALFGCQTAAEKDKSIANILAKHFNGHVVGALGKINFDGGDPYSPDKKEFITYDGTTNTQNSLIPPECCCNK